MKKSDSKIRDSKFELLRIFAMCCIVVSHYAWHGGCYQNGNITNQIIGGMMSIGGRLGVNLFVMISAYFIGNIDEGCEKIRIKELVKIIIQVTVYTIVFFIISICVDGVKIGFWSLFRTFFALFYEYWFVPVYIAMILFSPYLNIMLKNLTKKMMQNLLILLMVFCSVIPTIMVDSLQIAGNLGTFIMLYVFVVYWKTYMMRHKNRRIWIVFMVISYVFIVGSEYFFIKYYPVRKAYFLVECYRIPMVILSISIFVCVVTLCKSFYSYWINLIASSMFGVYLFHGNNWFNTKLWRLFGCERYYTSHKMLFHAIFVVFVIMAVGIVVDKLYNIIIKFIIMKVFPLKCKILKNHIDR